MCCMAYAQDNVAEHIKAMGSQHVHVRSVLTAPGCNTWTKANGDMSLTTSPLRLQQLWQSELPGLPVQLGQSRGLARCCQG